jgi:hypothetical protein
LADVATALAANLRMIRKIAEIYGGRSGLVGNWRLTRAVMTHRLRLGLWLLAMICLSRSWVVPSLANYHAALARDW